MACQFGNAGKDGHDRNNIYSCPRHAPFVYPGPRKLLDPRVRGGRADSSGALT